MYLLAQHSRCAEDLEAELVGIPVELDSGGRHLTLGAAGPENGRRIASLENRDHRVEPVLRQRGDGGFLGGHGGSRREGMNSYLDCKSFFSTTKISRAIPTRNQFGPCSQHLFGGRVLHAGHRVLAQPDAGYNIVTRFPNARTKVR